MEGTVNDIPPSVIDGMIHHGAFEMDYLTVAVDDDTRTSTVNLVLSPNDGLEPDGLALSGFPKVLANECTKRPHMPRSRTASSRNLEVSPSTTVSGRSVLSSGSGVSRSGSITLNGTRPKILKQHLWAPSRGPLAGLKQLDRDSSAPEVHMVPSVSTREPQISYRDVKGPNRFWAYIGPAHMAKNRHLYNPTVLEKFVPSIAAEPVELDAGDESEIKRMPYAELDSVHRKPKRASIHHEVHGDSSPKASDSESGPSYAPRPRKDSARDLSDSPSVTETVMGDYTVRLPPLPFTPPPAFPPKKRGFDPGELEEALEAAFG